jgi:amino acid transporter
MILSFILLVLGGPRLVNVIWWLLRPGAYHLAFPNILLGFLGVIFLPWTTLMYVLAFPGGMTGWDWLFIAIGFFADLASYGGSGYGGKKQMSGPSTPPPASATPAQ